MTAAFPAELAGYGIAGMAVGVLYFAALRRTVHLVVVGASVYGILLLYLVRGAAVVIVFWAIAQQGALPLVIALCGFVAARLPVQRPARPR